MNEETKGETYTNKGYIEKNQMTREGKVVVDEMRMQVQTQLDPNSVEYLVFDALGSYSGCDDLGLALNLRTISQYNFEQLKEKLRGFTRSIFDNIDACTQEYQPIIDPMVPQVNLVRHAEEVPSNEDLDKEIFLLEREILRELEETADLH